MGWKRRFGNRADVDYSPDDETPPELLEETTALGVGTNLLNNKIYPGKLEVLKDKEADIRKKEVELQKMICILLCTVFPFLTTVATLLRLWQLGFFISHSSGCPVGWHPYSHYCYQNLPEPHTWSQAVKECSALRAKLPSNSPANNFLLSTFRSSFWIETAVDVISEDKKLLRNGNSSAFEMKEKCEYISRAAEVLYRNCDKTLTTVCQRTEDLT